MEVWRRFYCLSGGERSIVLEAAGGLAATWLGLRLAGFRRWGNLLIRLLPTKIHATNDVRSEVTTSAQQISRLELAATRNFPLRTNCLEQSLVLWWLLQRRGIAAELRIGARKDADRFEAHAWVELDGKVLNEPGEEHIHFVPFDAPVASLETQ
jgi:transglutaminase superfamily protein